jgi:DNA-binding transcriptional LysR family regulator
MYRMHETKNVSFDPRYLLTLIAISSAGSFSKAAKKLNITEGAVSHQVKAMEKALKIQIFERQVNGVKFTTNGKALLRQSFKLQRLLEETYKIFGLSYSIPTLTIKIVAGEISALTFLPKLVQSFSRSNRVEFIVQTLSAISCLRALMHGEADIAFVGSVSFEEFKNERRHYFVRKLFERRLVAVVPPEHPLANRTTVSLKELAKYDFITRSYGSAVRNRVEELFKKEHIDVKKLSIRFFFQNSSSILSAVTSGLGVSIVADIQAARLAEKGLIKTIDLEHNKASIPIYIVTHKDNPNPVVRRFMDYVTKYKDMMNN